MCFEREEERMMERLHFSMKIREGMEQEYEDRHREVWPALQADLYAAGWRNYSLFRRGLTVHAYAECHPDIATASSAMDGSEANAKWQAWFTEVLEQVVDDQGRLFMAEQVWHLDEELARRELEGRNGSVTGA